jgi:hypothetical protein
MNMQGFYMSQAPSPTYPLFQPSPCYASELERECMPERPRDGEASTNAMVVAVHVATSLPTLTCASCGWENAPPWPLSGYCTMGSTSHLARPRAWNARFQNSRASDPWSGMRCVRRCSGQCTGPTRLDPQVGGSTS